MQRFEILIGAVLLCGCSGGSEEAPSGRGDNAEVDDSGASESATGWTLRSGEEEITLSLGPAAEPALRLVCPAGKQRLLVNVPAFQPIGSEERLSFGSGGEVVALVADTRGDPARGGVSATGEVPDNFEALLSGPVSASYGAQTGGPHQAPPENLAKAFVAACGGADIDREVRQSPAADSNENVSECLIQNGRRLPENRLKAIGTEPFWAADIRGRCVTYSTPENQQGTRIWAQFSGSRDSGSWTGYYQDERFILRTRPEPGCSDGMSDKRYPVAVTLTVGGEQRRGCAERL